VKLKCKRRESTPKGVYIVGATDYAKSAPIDALWMAHTLGVKGVEAVYLPSTIVGIRLRDFEFEVDTEGVTGREVGERIAKWYLTSSPPLRKGSLSHKNLMKKKKLCVECAHKHRFEIPKREGIALPGYVYIDGKKWISWHRPPSRKVRCSECGRKTNEVFEPF